MRDIFKNRFLVWLMWLVPIACTGWFSVYVWTLIQICLCILTVKEEAEKSIPPWKDKRIVELNRNENLTKDDKLYILSHGAQHYKIGENTYSAIDAKKNFWKNVEYSKDARDIWSKEWADISDEEYFKKHGKYPVYACCSRGWSKDIYESK